MSLDVSAAACAPVFAWNPEGSTSWMRSRRSFAFTPGSAATSIVSHLPLPFSAVWPVCLSKTVSVAPPRLSAEPNPKMPVIVARIGGPCSSTVTTSPMRKSYLRAVWASMPISPARRGGRPVRARTPDNWGSFVAVTPRVGAPPVVTAFPSLATSCAYPARAPSATRTPGTFATTGMSDPGTRSAGPASMPLEPPLNSGIPLTCTATPLVTCLKRLSNARFIVSVRM